MRARLFVLTLTVTACSGGGGNPSDSPSAGDESPQPASIHQIQGDGATSPLEGRIVTVDGIVTGDFQAGDADDSRNLGGFYIQGETDDDVETSDGVFVFDGGNPATDVDVGDSVTVVGEVTEYFGETQVAASRVQVVGSGGSIPVPVNLPAATVISNSDGELIANLERYEGMYVRFPQTLTITSLRNLERFGAMPLAQGGRPYQFTNQNSPSAAGYAAYRSALAARVVFLDDGRRGNFDRPIAFLAGGNTLRVGDEVADLTGNLRFSRGSGGSGFQTYRVMPTAEPAFFAANPRPDAPAAGGSLRVASVNADNFFSAVDSGQAVCGPNGDDSCRGADSQQELDRQLGKLTTMLNALDADIVGLVEVENNGGEALELLVASLNAASRRDYVYVDTEVLGGDAITTALIFDRASVVADGDPAILDRTIDPRFNDRRNRPALAQAFRQVSDGAVLSVVATHLKSKGSDCDDDGDPNRGDGQGNCNRTRASAAAALADWVATDPTGSGDPDYLVVGDLNAYVFEDPLVALQDAGFTNLVERAVGGDAYSFVFDGQSGALDHALASPSLVPQLVAAAEWHVNADEPPALDYNLENERDPALFDMSTPFRSGDHDPLVIGLDLD